MNTNVGFNITERMLVMPGVEQAIAKWKSKGLAMCIYIKFLLKKCRNGIGNFKNLKPIADKMGVQKHTLINMIKECELYHCDEKRGLFWCPRMRNAFHLALDPSEDELNDIITNGSVYVRPSKTRGRDCSGSATIRNAFEEHSPNANSQQADNQQEYADHSKSKVISYVSKEIVSTKAEQKQVSVCTSDDDADEKELREILSSKSWRKSVTKRMGIDLMDESILSKFAEWMFVYCCSKEKKLKGKSETRCYAANLLRPETKTRAELDRFIEEGCHGTVSTKAKTEEEPSKYEQIFGKIRFSAAGHHLPDWAPQQPSLDVSFSYTSGRWVRNEEIDKEKELAMLENLEKNSPEYFTKEGGVSC